MPIITARLPELLGGQPSALGILRRLEGGAVLTGRVQLPTPAGTTPVQIGAAVLQLLLGQNLQPGTLVNIRSEGGRILVEPQPTPASGAPLQAGAPPTAATAPTPLAAFFSGNPALVQSLQLNQLPVTLETLQILQTALGTVPLEQAPLLAFLLARNLPITAEILPLLRERLRARGNLGSDLSTLLGEIRSLLGSGNLPQSEPLSNLLAQLQQLLAWDTSGDLGERIEKLKDFLTTLEQKLLGGKGDAAQADFKSLLLRLEALLAQSGFGPDHPLRAAAQRTIGLLEGAQLSGLSQQPAADPEAWVFWRIPFPGEPLPTTVELAMRGERDPENPERFDPKNLEILIQVDLSALGPVRVHVRSFNEELKITLTVTAKEHYERVQMDLPELVRALNEAGYEKVQTDVRVEAIASDSLADWVDPLKDWRLDPTTKGGSSLDIRL